MQINAAKAYGLYSSNRVKQADSESAASARMENSAAPAKSGNTDQVSISFEGVRQREIEKVSNSILSEITEPTSPEKLSSIQSAVRENSYYIPTGDLVNAVMNRWFGL